MCLNRAGGEKSLEACPPQNSRQPPYFLGSEVRGRQRQKQPQSMSVFTVPRPLNQANQTPPLPEEPGGDGVRFSAGGRRRDSIKANI